MMTTPLNSSNPAIASKTSSFANDDLKLQAATQYCSKGRQAWSSGNHSQALSDFRHALLILETLLGNQHILVAQLYHWMGLILQEQLDYSRAEQCFVKFLRIRYALQDESKGGLSTSNLSDATVMQAQVSLSNLWQAQGISSSNSFEMIRNLQESVKLEQEGDAVLKRDVNPKNGQPASPNYLVAMKIYQQAMNAFPDAHHESTMRKMAVCYHQAKGSGSSVDSLFCQPKNFLDQAVVWYRMALKVFCTSCRFSESVMEPNSVHQSLMTSHPEYINIQQHLEKVLHDYHLFDFAKIKQYIERGDVRKSVLHQYAAERALSSSLQKRSEGGVEIKTETMRSPTIHDLAEARREYKEAMVLERNMFQQLENRQHLVLQNLQKELSSLDQRYISQLEEERGVSQERLHLLEQQASDWISTVRHQEDQLQKLQSSFQNREGHAAEALNAAASKEAELVGWKRKFETMQLEWKEAQKNIQALESEKVTMQHTLKQAQNKVGQLEYTFKKQDLDFHNLQETIQRRSKEADDWKEQYHAALQAQQHAQQKLERSQATERELHAQIKDLQSQNVVLKDWNKELQAEQHARSPNPKTTSHELENKQKQILELEDKLKNVTTTKDRAIKKLKKYHHQRQQQQGSAEEATEVIIFLEDKVQVLENDKARLERLLQERQQSSPGKGNRKQNVKKQNMSTSSDVNVETVSQSLAARLEKSNDALATLHAEHSVKLAEIESLEKSKKELEGSFADAQEIIAMLKKVNDERVERIDELKAENDLLKSQVSGGHGSMSLHLNDANTENLDSETSNMLIDQIADLELQNEELREQLDNTTEDNRNLATAVKSLKAKLNEVTVTKSLGSVVGRSIIGDTERSTTGDTEHLEKRLNEAEQANEELAAMVETMRKQIKELTSPDRDDSSGRSSVRATVLETELREAKLQIESLSANAKAFQMACESSKRVLEEKEILKGRVAELEEQLDICIAKEQKLTDTLKTSQEQLGTTRKEVEEKERLLSRLWDIENELKETSSHRQILLSENTSFKNQLDSALEEIEEKKRLVNHCTQLEEDLKKSREDEEKLREEGEILREEMETLKSKFADSAEMDYRLGCLTKEVVELTDKLEVAQKQNDKLTKEATSLQAQLNSSSHGAQEENIRLLEQCSTLERKLEAAKEQINDLRTETESEVHALQEQNAVLEEELRRSREQNEALSLEISGPMEDAEQDRLQLTERCLSLEKRLHETMAQNQKIASQAEQNSKGLAEMLAKESQEQQRLVNQCTQYEKQLDEARDQNEQLVAEAKALSDQLLELQSKLDRSDSDHLSEKDDLLKKCHELEEKLDFSLQEQNRTSANNLEKLEEMEKEIQDLTVRNTSLEDQIALYQEKLEDNMGKEPNGELAERCNTLEQELHETLERNDELTNQVDTLSDRVRDLQALAEKKSTELENAQDMIQTLEAREAPGDEDFARLLERCTDLEAEKSSIEYELKQQKGNSAVIDEIKKERDELQQELDAALADLVELQQFQSGRSTSSTQVDNDQLNERLEALADAKDELKKLLDEAVQENADLIQAQRKMSEAVRKAKEDRDNIDSLYHQAKQELAEVKSQMIAFEELLKESKAESEEFSRLLEIEKQVSSSRKAAANADDDEENELEDLYRQAREEMKELEEMLTEAEEQIEHLKSKCEKLEKKTELSRQDLVESELSSETVHSLDGLSREELIKENRKVLHKLQEARTHSIDQQENITILQAQLRDALKFHEIKKAPPRKSSGSGPGFGGFWNLGKKETPKKPEEETPKED